tara:strand:- start:958 stop:1176 length:219 start_codon:yes stop_codon:yes gene_type:complete
MKFLKLLFLISVLINLNSNSFADNHCSGYSTDTIMGMYNKRKCILGIKQDEKLSLKQRLKLLNPLQKKIKND